jgi:hypothetical protein
MTTHSLPPRAPPPPPDAPLCSSPGGAHLTLSVMIPPSVGAATGPPSTRRSRASSLVRDGKADKPDGVYTPLAPGAVVSPTLGPGGGGGGAGMASPLGLPPLLPPASSGKLLTPRERAMAKVRQKLIEGRAGAGAGGPSPSPSVASPAATPVPPTGAAYVAGGAGSPLLPGGGGSGTTLADAVRARPGRLSVLAPRVDGAGDSGCESEGRQGRMDRDGGGSGSGADASGAEAGSGLGAGGGYEEDSLGWASLSPAALACVKQDRAVLSDTLLAFSALDDAVGCVCASTAHDTTPHTHRTVFFE